MPTVLRIGAYRFFFYANEGDEPAHIHVQRDNAVAKFWLHPVRYASSTGFSARELNSLFKTVEEYQTIFEEAWHEFFSN